MNINCGVIEMIYAYPAVFHQFGEVVNVYYPDLACISQGNNYRDAFKNAHEGLSLHLYGMIEDGEKLPKPSRLESIKLSENEALALIEVDLKGFEPDWSQS